MRRCTLRNVAGVVAAVLVLAACSGGSGGDGEPPTRDIPVGPGVSSRTITLGLLTDLTGPFAVLGRTVTQGAQLFWKDQNQRGGVCGRTVYLVIKNHAGNVQDAVALYASLQPHVLAFQQLLGSPMTAALLGSIASDAVLTQPVSWSSKLLANPYIVMGGATYDLEMINGIDWLMKNRGLKAGDKIGHLYLEGEYGEDALLGTIASAKANNLTVVSERVQAGDIDMTAHVRAIRAAGARFVMISTTAPQAASAAMSAQSQGFDATFVGSNPTFLPSILEGPAKTAMTTRFWISQSYAPLSGDTPGASTFRSAYTTAYRGETANAGAAYGYAQGEIMYRILNAACTSGSLERPAMLEAVRTLQRVDTDGLIAPLDYSRPGQPPARATYILQPDPTALGGLTVVQPLRAAPPAQTYSCPC